MRRTLKLPGFHATGVWTAHQDRMGLGQIVARHAHQQMMLEVIVDEVRRDEHAF